MFGLLRHPDYSELSQDTLLEGLRRAFDDRQPQILQRKPVGSFHHLLEHVRVEVPGSPEPREVELFVRVYLGQLCCYEFERCNQPAREWTGWRVAAQAGLPLPQTLWQGDIDGTSLAIQHKQPGSTVWETCTPDLIAECGRTLAQLHSARVSDADRDELADASLDGMLTRFSALATDLENELTIKATRHLASLSQTAATRPNGFMHGDWHPGNLLTNGHKVTAIIDWEDAAWGDPHIDLVTMDDFLRRDIRLTDRLRRRELNQLADTFHQAYSEAAGWTAGSLEFWSRLLDVGWLITGDWLQYRMKHELPYPVTRPGPWLWFARRARRRVSRWTNTL